MKIIKKVIKVGDSNAIILPKDLINGEKIKIGDYIEIDFNSIKKIKKNQNEN